MAQKPVAKMAEWHKTYALLNGESKSSGSKYRLPKLTIFVCKAHGIDVNGNVVTAVVLQLTPHPYKKSETFYVIQYREVNRQRDMSSRTVRQFSGFDARLRMETEIKDVLRLLRSSRILAANGIPWITSSVLSVSRDVIETTEEETAQIG